MIEFNLKPGINAYWVRDYRYTKLAGRVYQENIEITGYGRFHPANLETFWDGPCVKVYKDGDNLCALVGPDLQAGTAEFVKFEEDKDLFDQITDHARAFMCAHPEVKHCGTIQYWKPEEIDLMAEQSRPAPRRKSP